jgi:outer membrane biosynthesis protein TonB
MAAALRSLQWIARWRWTPFFALLGGSLIYVAVVLLVVPTKIAAPSSPTETLVILNDDGSQLTTSVGRAPRGNAPRVSTPMAQPGAGAISEPMPPPHSEPPAPPAPVAPMVEPRPQPEAPPAPPPPQPQPPPPPQPQEEDDEDDEEEEQGAAPPPRVPGRSIAGALRLLPPGSPPLRPAGDD